MFDGKLSLTDVLNTDLSLLNQMQDVKLEFLNQQQSNKKSYSATANPENLKKAKL